MVALVETKLGDGQAIHSGPFSQHYSAFMHVCLCILVCVACMCVCVSVCLCIICVALFTSSTNIQKRLTGELSIAFERTVKLLNECKC